MIISFKGYDDSGGLHINHMNENQPNRTYFHRFGYRILEYTYIRFGILPTMITTFGIRSNAHSSIAQTCLTMDDLFQ